MSLAVVTTDGSCISSTRHERGPGGWAAIIEDGSDGWVLRGQEYATTSTKMELLAAIEGLRALPDGKHVRLVYDCTAILGVFDRWQRGVLPQRGRGIPFPRDGHLWVELADEFERLHVELQLLERSEVNLPHRRAHMIAQAQARALARGVDGDFVPLPQHPRKRRLVHDGLCTMAVCVDWCPFHVREVRRLLRG